jgi:acyl-CoA thioester hydrolase
VEPSAPPALFRVRLVLPVQWGEMDSYGHVNNAVYFRWFESARMEYFARLGWPELERETGVGPILHSTRARFRAPLEWPDEVEVSTRVTGVEADRFTMLYEVRSRRLDRLACEGSGLVVAYDYRAGAKAALPAAIRDRIAALEREGA